MILTAAPTEKLPEGWAMGSLIEDNAAARTMGLSYGKYKALIYQQETCVPPKPQKQSRRPRRRYTDEQAFALWQAGKNDCEIGIALGVSRQIIQRWRDTMELPSTIKGDIDTSRYRLVKTGVGNFVLCDDETEPGSEGGMVDGEEGRARGAGPLGTPGR